MRKTLVSKHIAEYLQQKGVNHIFELTGGMVSHLLDAIHLYTHIKLVSVHHEQAASFAADAYARVTGIPSVAIATSGPGAINLLTGIGNCYYDSVPAVFITGQVNSYERKGNNIVRQLGFQENDIVTMVAPICKKAIAVERIEDIPSILDEAFRIAISDRPGPVLIDLPMDFQRQEIETDHLTNHVKSPISTPKIHQQDIIHVVEAIKAAKRPIVLAGRGIRSSASLHLFQQFIELSQIPVVTSLLGLDVLPYDHPQRIGFIGVYGNRWANMALYDADLLIVLGSRIDIRQTGADIKSLQLNKQIIHVDIDPHEINLRLKECYAVHADLKDFLTTFLLEIKNTPLPQSSKDWENTIAKNRHKYPDTKELFGITGINPNEFIHKLSKASVQATAYIADVGNHQMWCAQSLELSKEQLFITSGGMGAMGYSLPAGMGATLAAGNKPVVSISGDGGFQLNLQELETICHLQLPVKIVVFNNQSLGMIRQFQDSYFEQRHVSSEMGYSAPNFELIAKAYCIDSITIDKPDEIDGALHELWKAPTKPFLLQVMIDPTVNAFPKISFGHPINKMEPYLDNE